MPLKKEFKGKTDKNGKPCFYNTAGFFSFFKPKPDCDFVISVQLDPNKRDGQINLLNWWLRVIAKETGYDFDELDETLKKMYGFIICKNNRINPIKTVNLSKENLKEYLQRIKLLSDWLNISLPNR